MPFLPVEKFRQNLPATLTFLKELVAVESPSTDKSAVDRVGAIVQDRCQALGAEIEIFPQAESGDHFAARWGQGPGGLLLLCHMDTVYDLGTLAAMPFYESGGKLFGPGVLDMKASIAMILEIIRLWREGGVWPQGPVTALFTSDEETGSLTSSDLIVAQARTCRAAFCLEPALASGKIKTARKGTGDIEIRVQGVAAHAGVDHEKGRNAIEELAHHVLAAQKLTDYHLGTTVNVGVISGGTRGNVVPEEAHALIDFRVTTMREVDRLKSWLENLPTVVEGTRLQTSFALNRPPMPRDAIMAAAYEKARAIAGQMGFDLTEGSTGGGSDANFVAPLGLPVLDGLGPVGDGAHSEREFVWVDSIAERSAQLSAILLNW